MKLELGNFYVKDIVFGDKTKYENGILTVDKEDCLAFVKRDPHITEADLRIVKPGDMGRLVPVKEAVECRVKVNGDALFPGYTGPLSQAGDGRTHCLKDMSLLAVGSHWGGFQDGLNDMEGKALNIHISPNLRILFWLQIQTRSLRNGNSRRKTGLSGRRFTNLPSTLVPV